MPNSFYERKKKWLMKLEKERVYVECVNERKRERKKVIRRRKESWKKEEKKEIKHICVE